MPLALYLALKQLFPSGRRASVFALMALMGVTLGVTTLVVVQSVMNGFSGEIRDNLNQTSGDIRVEAPGPIAHVQPLLELLRDQPEVALAEGYAEGIVMLQFENRPAFPAVRGLDLMQPEHVTPIGEHLLEGTLEALDDERVIMGSGLARQLGVRTGDVVDIYTPLMLERMKQDEVLLPREFEVIGLLETGYGEIDQNTLVVSLRTLQDLYGLDRAVHGVMVKLKSGEDPESVALDWNRTLLDSGLVAYTWMDAHESFLFVLAFEKTAMFVLNLIIVVVSAFCIAVALYTSVVRKTREIGLLGAMGAGPRTVAAIYCLQGLIVGLAGSLLGFLCSWALLSYREPALRWLLRVTEKEAVFIRFYHFLRFPVRFEWNDFLLVFVFTVTLTTVAALLPAWLAAKQKPAEALRHE
jgi:lipoprotein-releasing system permease protein